MKKALLLAGLGTFVLVVVGCGTSAVDEEVDVESTTGDYALSPSCDAVRCALPLCGEGQHLAYQGGSCCPTCVGPVSRCASVLCAMVMCAEGYQPVTPKGQCCPRCAPVPPVAECTTDADCPVFSCITCPCPVSECVGRTCRTSTPDASTCGL